MPVSYYDTAVSMPGSCNPKLARPAALGYAPGMPDQELALIPPSSPFSANALEGEIIAAASLDPQARQAVQDKLQFTAFSFLAGSVIRDARMLARCKLFKPNDEERGHYIRALNDCLGAYHSLFPERPVQVGGSGHVVIDVPSTVRPARTAQSS
jgi:hypothetical protein